MPRGKDTSPLKVTEIKTLLRNTELSHREIARRVNVSNFTVSKIAREGLNVTNRSRRRGHCGRKSKTTEADKRFLKREIRRNYGTTTAKLRKSLEEAGTCVSRTTVWRRLKEMDCESLKPRRIPLLTRAMKSKRLEFARNFQHWTSEDWKKVNDE